MSTKLKNHINQIQDTIISNICTKRDESMKKIICVVLLMVLFPVLVSWADDIWEKEGNYYFLTKNSRDYFSAKGPGANKFASKYLTYDGIDFLVKGPNNWEDYGRLDLSGNNLFPVPIPRGFKVDELHLLAGGSYSNSYKEDPLLSLYGDNYYYSVITVLFVYEDGSFKSLSVPMFWDLFHLGRREWSKEGAKIKGLGNNPVRKDCSLYHLSFKNPSPAKPLRNILVSDSWLSDVPFSDIFALTLKSKDTLEAGPAKKNH